MKTFTTTLALVLTATVMMAFPNRSQLIVEVLGHRSNSLIVINGQKYSSLQNVVNLDGLMPEITLCKFCVRPTGGDQGVVFNGTIQVPGRSSVHAVIARNRMTVDAVPLAHQHGGNYWDGNGQSQGTTHIPSPNGNGGFVSTLPHHQPVVQPVVCPPAYIGMHPEAFVGALESIKAQWFDSDRIRVAKQIIRTNPISSQQIAEIMQLMSFESSRLELAKFSYQFVADRANFYMVNDVFWFSSSVRELDRFINRC